MRRWVLAATVLGSTMAFIDGTVVNVALPILQRELRAGIDDVQWIVDAYLLVMSSLILVGGSLGDRFGRVRVFGIGVALFAAASAWCGAAGGAQSLIAARALQGVGAALLVPGSLAIITAVFPPNERGKAIGTWSALTSLAIIAGPVLGGVLVQTISWRAVFFINLPIAAVVLWIAWRRMPPSPGRDSGAIDWLGALLVTLGLGGVVFALIEMPSRGASSPAVLIAGIGGVVALIAFVVWEMRVANPLVPLGLFRSRSFTGANVLTLFLYAALSVGTFLLPFHLISVRGTSPSGAGAAMLPMVAAMSLLSRFTGALADRMGPRIPLTVGPLVAAAAFALLAFATAEGSYWTEIFPGMMTLGIGMAITVAPLTTTVMTSIDDEKHAGAASGINNAVARAAGLLAIAVFGAAAVFVFARGLERRLPPGVRETMLAQRLKLAAAEAPRNLDAATRARVNAAVRASFLDAYRIDMLAAAVLAAASAAGALIIKGRAPRDRAPSPSAEG